MTRTIELAAFAIALLVAALAAHAWLAAREEMQLLQSTLAAQKQVIEAADSRERARDASLDEAVAQIAKEKRAVQTPAEILRNLPNYLPLPQPITLANTSAPSGPRPQQGTALPASPLHSAATSAPQHPTEPSPLLGSSQGAQNTGAAFPSSTALWASQAAPATRTSVPAAPPAAAAEIPAADLKPLYDYVQDCRSCDLELAAAKQNHADDTTKIAALTHERDAAVTTAKGGSFLRRLRRNCLWFFIGASAGYLATRR